MELELDEELNQDQSVWLGSHRIVATLARLRRLAMTRPLIRISGAGLTTARGNAGQTLRMGRGGTGAPASISILGQKKVVCQ